MRLRASLIGLSATLFLSGCGGFGFATRGATTPQDALVPAAVTANSANWTVTDVRVDVPRSLRVSEANRYYPIANIVWRGEPFGDRHQQVGAILDEGLTRGVSHLDGPQPVVFDVSLRRFHALSDKARYTVGGVHNIIFDLTVSDATTGQAIYGPEKIELNLKAYGGAQGFTAEQRGHTQKVRILSHLTNTMRRQFGGVVGAPIIVEADDALASAAPE